MPAEETVPTYIENLTTVRDDAAQVLATAVTLQKTKPKPSYNVGGRSIGWVEYHTHLRQLYADANQDLINASAGEVHTIVLG